MKQYLTNIVVSLAMAALLLISVPFTASAASSYYINSSGQQVHVPVRVQKAPVGATAKCKDGIYSFSRHRSGTCSGHRGVSQWL